MSRIAIALALLLVPVAISPLDKPQTPEIRVSTQLVRIDVIVRDKNGPIADLTKDDFTLFDRGKPEPISLFSVNSVAHSADLAQASLATNLLPPDTFSNSVSGTAAPGSVTIILLDNLNTLSDAPSGWDDPHSPEKSPFWAEYHAFANAEAHLIQFVETLDPRDRVAIYGLGNSLRVLCDFTSDRAELLAILKKYDTRSVTSREKAEPTGVRGNPYRAGVDRFNGGMDESALGLASITNEDRAQTTMTALEEIAYHVADIPGRKNLVWLTANLPFSGVALARILGPAQIAAYPIDARGLLTRGPISHPGGAGFANSSKDPATIMTNAEPVGIETMRQLAEETGGEAFVNTNDVTGAIRDAVEDSAVTYTLGFYISRSALDAEFHPIKVNVNRKDVFVRYAKGYFAIPPNDASKDQSMANMVGAIESPLESSAISLRATLSRGGQDAPHSLQILCSIDAHDLRFVQSGSVQNVSFEVYVIEQDQTGKILHQSGRTYKLHIPQNEYVAILKSGIVYRGAVQLAAGTATVRIIVEDMATGEAGSLIIPLSRIA